MRILLGTGNNHKVRELKELFALFLPGLSIEFLTLKDFPDFTPAEEVGESFEEIAKKKALDAANMSGLLTLSEDSGLVVPALGGAPGLKSARYATPPSDRANREKLLSEIQGFDELARSAYYICAMSLALPGKVIKTTQGKCEGTLVKEERGSSSFGYDPIFLRYDYHKTFGELAPSVKNRISHRSRAFQLMEGTLRSELLALCR